MRPILRKSSFTQMLFGMIVIAVCVFAGTRRKVSATPAEDSAAMLLEAIRLGDRADVNALLQKGAPPNAKLPDGTSALMEATVADDAGLLRALLDRGANVNTKNQAGATALMLTVSNLGLCSFPISATVLLIRLFNVSDLHPETPNPVSKCS